MTLLHTMRRLRHTLGQGLVAVFAMAWLGLVAHNCAMAGQMGQPGPEDAELAMGHAGHGMDHTVADSGHGADCCCCDEAASAPHCLTPACDMSAVTLQTTETPLGSEPIKLVLLPEAQAPPQRFKPIPFTVPAHYSLAYLPLHPTLRYCTLLI